MSNESYDSEIQRLSKAKTLVEIVWLITRIVGAVAAAILTSMKLFGVI